jgi:hypothetical protein
MLGLGGAASRGWATKAPSEVMIVPPGAIACSTSLRLQIHAGRDRLSDRAPQGSFPEPWALSPGP